MCSICKMVGAILMYQIEYSASRQSYIKQASGLQPEGIKSPAKGNGQGFGAGKHGIEQAVFLYNGLRGIFD